MKMTDKDYIEYCKLLNGTTIPSNLSTDERDKRKEPLLHWVDQHTPAKLYKFRECNENNINAFRNQQIWFATGAKMNDDYDAILYSDNERILADLCVLFGKNGNLTFFKTLKEGGNPPPVLYEIFGAQFIENTKKILADADETLIKQISSTIKTLTEDGFKEQFPFITQSVQRVIKFSSFSEAICSPLMWGNYADNSSGFALAYDFRNRNYNECLYCDKRGTCPVPKSNELLPIVYRDKRVNATEYARFVMQNSFTQRLLYNLHVPAQLCGPALATITCSDLFMQTKIVNSKFKDWSYEEEWRLTINYQSPSYATDQTAYIRKKPCALYLGRKIKDTDELILRNIAYEQHIPVYKMQIDEIATDYELKPTRQNNTVKDLHLKQKAGSDYLPIYMKIKQKI